MNLGSSLINLLDWYMQNSHLIMPIVLSVLTVIIMVLIVGVIEDNIIRAAMLIPLAALFFWLSTGGGEFEQEYFLNLGTELVGALAAIIIFAGVLTSQGWTFPLIGTLIAVLIFFMNINNLDLHNGFALNMSTELLGTLLTTVILKREWLWSPTRRSQVLWQTVRHDRRQKAQQKAAFGDFYILIMAADEDEIATKIQFLQASQMQVNTEGNASLDTETGFYFATVKASIETTVKVDSTAILANREARIRILAYPDTAQRVYEQISEVLRCTALKTLPSSSEFTELELQANAPQELFSKYLSQEIKNLARRWRMSPQAHLPLAVDDLLKWANERNFTK